MTTSPHAGSARRVGVIVPSGFPGLPTYTVPEGFPELRPGQRVLAPFGQRMLTAVVAQLSPPVAPDEVRERPLLALLDEAAVLPEPVLEAVLSAATYYFAPPGELLRAAVPARLLAEGELAYRLTGTEVPASEREGDAGLLLASFAAKASVRFQDLAGIPGLRRPALLLRDLERKGFIAVEESGKRAERAATEAFLDVDPKAVLPESLDRRPAVKALIEKLRQEPPLVPLKTARTLGATPERVELLASLGLVRVVTKNLGADLKVHAGTGALSRAVELTAAQIEAVRSVTGALSRQAETTLLLDGITGSGKTEVYLAALQACRQMGKTAIFLVPEIALAPALVRRILARLGTRVSLLHSGLSDRERAGEWSRTRDGEADVVVGPRSAVFAPLSRLGLIVIDEAHDAAYKQAESPRYDARDVARSRARREGAVLLLGSATPSMEQERQAREKRIPRLSLPERPGIRRTASVEVIDLKAEPFRPGDHGRILFARRTLELLSQTFERGEQAILLLNRRGFAPTLLCRSCGQDFRCVNCSVARTLHKRWQRLLCHYCGNAMDRPSTCPACQSESLMPVGFGTERLAERFEEAFPGVPYAVLDRDAAARRGGAARVLLDFESGRARALLGTQMVAKGHDFPNATALAVLDADALLSFPDFRAAERTFQLLTQAAGRVGRGDKPGIVTIQTARPEHPAIRAAVQQDHRLFSDAELEFRKTFSYPPYSFLLLCLWSGESLPGTSEAAAAGRRALDAAFDRKSLRILGPAPAPLERLKGKYRFQILLKAFNRDVLREAGSVLRRLPDPPLLDIDPQNLL